MHQRFSTCGKVSAFIQSRRLVVRVSKLACKTHFSEIFLSTCEVSEKSFELNLEQNFSVKTKSKREKTLILKQN